MSEAAATAPTTATAGELLKAARERQGIHIAVLAAGLKVAPRKLELLEANRFDELPDATFVRALALSMCRSLKLDSEPVLARLPQSAAAAFVPGQGLNAPFRERGRDRRSEPGEWRRWLSLPVVAGGLLVVAAIALYLWPAGGWQSGVGGLAPAASAPVEPAASTVAEPVPQPVPTPPAASTAVADPAPVPAGAASATVETVFAAPPEAASAPADALLVLRASAESWIEVRDGGGALLLQRTLAAGEAAGVDGTLPLRVVVGNATATEVMFRGKPVPLVALTRDNIAKLELK
ncbi:MAG TPA: RodZ domain-containing protein [Methylibium sp.]|nr:RodZ domain-containing protein [Methylibium sp.]